MRGAGKAAVRQKGHGIAKPLADQRRSNSKHFAHTGATLRSLITNHNHIACLDDSFFDSGESCLFTVEDTRGATEMLQIVAGNFDDAALRGEVSLQDH